MKKTSTVTFNQVGDVDKVIYEVSKFDEVNNFNEVDGVDEVSEVDKVGEVNEFGEVIEQKQLNKS